MARSFAARHHCDGQDFAIGVKQIEQEPRATSVWRIGRGDSLVYEPCAVQVERETGLDVRLLREQHAAHVGVLDDCDRCGGRIARVRWTTLRPVAGVIERLEIAGITERDRAETDADPRLVHHVEHAGEPLVRLANEVADRADAALGSEPALAKAEQRVDGAAVNPSCG
jgi:hypothetical protein